MDIKAGDNVLYLHRKTSNEEKGAWPSGSLKTSYKASLKCLPEEEDAQKEYSMKKLG